MKVLLVNDYGTLAGGAEVQTGLLREELRARGIDARLMASTARAGGDSLGPEYECVGTTGRFRTLLQTANPWAGLRLGRALASFRPDVVHVKLFLTQLSPFILPFLRHVPSLYHAVWYRAICPVGTKLLPDGRVCRVPAGWVCHRSGCLPMTQWALLMMQRKLLERWRDAFDLVVANSGAVKDRLAAEGFGPIEVIRNGVPVRMQRPPLAESPSVAFAGRLVREKGVDVLLRAVARVTERLPDTGLIVAGDGPERQRLETLAGRLGLAGRVAFLGHLSREELERRLDGAWVQAVPSQWEEPFGVVAAEAMMRGTAVVASDSGGIAELVEHGHTGLKVPPGDVDTLAGALARLLTDRELAERMGAAGREVALRRFGMGAVVNRWIALYERLAVLGRDGRLSRGMAPGGSDDLRSSVERRPPLRADAP